MEVFASRPLYLLHEKHLDDLFSVHGLLGLCHLLVGGNILCQYLHFSISCNNIMLVATLNHGASCAHKMIPAYTLHVRISNAYPSFRYMKLQSCEDLEICLKSDEAAALDPARNLRPGRDSRVCTKIGNSRSYGKGTITRRRRRCNCISKVKSLFKNKDPPILGCRTQHLCTLDSP